VDLDLCMSDFSGFSYVGAKTVANSEEKRNYLPGYVE